VACCNHGICSKGYSIAREISKYDEQNAVNTSYEKLGMSKFGVFVAIDELQLVKVGTIVSWD
jgi:hypothetical protein